MPEICYRLRWPDNSEATYYSPSRVIKDYFHPGQLYGLDEFLARARTATQVASDRVAAKYGFACSRAAEQLMQIEQTAAQFSGWPAAQVQLIDFMQADR
jgi:uncharacterized repeat protein (TIGR04042 family)